MTAPAVLSVLGKCTVSWVNAIRQQLVLPQKPRVSMSQAIELVTMLLTQPSNKGNREMMCCEEEHAQVAAALAKAHMAHFAWLPIEHSV